MKIDQVKFLELHIETVLQQHPKQLKVMGTCLRLIFKDFIYTGDTEVLQPRQDINNVFPKQFGISGLLETLITPDELCGIILSFAFSNLSVRLFRRMLHCCFAAKLLKCFVGKG